MCRMYPRDPLLDTDSPLTRRIHGILRDTVNKRTVRILLECILVVSKCYKTRICLYCNLALYHQCKYLLDKHIEHDRPPPPPHKDAQLAPKPTNKKSLTSRRILHFDFSDSHTIPIFNMDTLSICTQSLVAHDAPTDGRQQLRTCLRKPRS